MKRVDIVYAGVHYSVGETDPEELKGRVLEVAAGAPPFWLRVNHGEGTYQEADLLIGPAASIVVLPIPADY
jgi:hypothetical protein